MENDLRKRENDLILKNERLVYYLSRKFENHPLYDEDDFASIGKIGLIKAARTFDNSKNIKFATYASTCINNEIRMYIRKNKNNATNAYLEDIINIDAEGNNLTLENLVSSKNSDFADKIIDKEMLEKFLNIVLNYFNSRNRLLWLYSIAGVTQKEISDILGISQSYISRLEKKIKNNFKKMLTTKLKFKEVFSMSITQNSFFIHFSAKDVENFNTVFADFLQKRILNRELLEFKVKRVQDTVTIQLPCDSESFAFIADIIKELDSDYTLLCAPKQSKSTEPSMSNSNVHNEAEDDDTESPVNSSVDEELPEEINNNPISEEVDSTPVSDEPPNDVNDLPVSEELLAETGNSPTPNRSGRTKSGVSQEIRDYIISLKPLEEFSNKQILSLFPSCSNSLLSQIIIKLKEKGLISPVSRGCYKKN